MINNDFVKGECGRCGGHLEFPAAATGQTIACPHCGQPTKLQPKAFPPASSPGKSSYFRLLWPAVIGCFILVVAIIGFNRHRHSLVFIPPSTPPIPGTNVPAPVAVPATSARPPLDQSRPGETVTNSFGISGGKMQKMPDSSIVYLLGNVRNLSDRQRFGVKVDYSLYDTNGRLIGHATDYESVIDPHGDWGFKAMVMESKAVSARLSGITEQ